MNTGQTLMTLGALVLITTSVLNFNHYIYDKDLQLMQNQYRMEALSILSEQVQQVSAQYFDEIFTDTSKNKNEGDLTASNQLGPDDNDGNIFDDIDDYHGQSIVVTGESGAPYRLFFEVAYVRLNSGTIVTDNHRRYHKRVRISIVDDYASPLIYKYVNGAKVRDTLSVSFVKGFWVYN